MNETNINGHRTVTLAKESKEEKVEVRNFFLIKHITEKDRELFAIGTFVQSSSDLNYDLEKSIEELSDELFFEYRFNDLTADNNSGWVKPRRAELTSDTARKTYQVIAPLEIQTEYDRFPFKTVRASVMIELSSSAFADNRKRPTLLLHKSDKGQNVALQLPLKRNTKGLSDNEMEKEFIKKMDKSIAYDLITPYPEVSYLYDKKKEYCPKFEVSFYMVESGISKLIGIIFPMILVAVLNTLQVLGEQPDSGAFIANASTFALTAVVILPHIITKKKLETVFSLNNLYIMFIFTGLSLSSIPEATFESTIPAKIGMILLWVSFLAPIYGCIGYIQHRRHIRDRAPKKSDRVPTAKGNSKTDLITVKDAVNISGIYKMNEFEKFVEVYG